MFTAIPTYRVTKQNEICSDNRFVELDSKEECKNALSLLQEEFPGFVWKTVVSKPDRPPKCFYSEGGKGVYWNTNIQGKPNEHCKAICKGKCIVLL